MIQSDDNLPNTQGAQEQISNLGSNLAKLKSNKQNQEFLDKFKYNLGNVEPYTLKPDV